MAKEEETGRQTFVVPDPGLFLQKGYLQLNV